jgi:tetratricopeptide (TPR) repeat protein
MFLASMGRSEEAIAALERALELDPLSPYTHAVAGNGFMASGRTDLAIAAHEKALSLDPDFLLARLFVAAGYARESRLDDAVKSLERAVELGQRGSAYMGQLGLAYGASGRAAEAERLLAELEARSSSEYVSPLCFAGILLGLGRNEEAGKCLERAYEAHDPGLATFFFAPICFGVKADDIVDDFTRRLRLRSFGASSRRVADS